jgi:hypothetical protein
VPVHYCMVSFLPLGLIELPERDSRIHRLDAPARCKSADDASRILNWFGIGYWTKVLSRPESCFDKNPVTAQILLRQESGRSAGSGGPQAGGGWVRSLSLRTKYRYAPTLRKLINTAIMFHTTTGREAINNP